MNTFTDLFIYDVDEPEGITTTGVPGNSHMMNTTANTHATEIEPVLTGSEPRKSNQDEEISNPRKEKSVLQAKLTKLAIQIGYGGMKIFQISNANTQTNIDTYSFTLFPFESPFYILNILIASRLSILTV